MTALPVGTLVSFAAGSVGATFSGAAIGVVNSIVKNQMLAVLAVALIAAMLAIHLSGLPRAIAMGLGITAVALVTAPMLGGVLPKVG